VDRRRWIEDSVHHAGQSMGERLRRELNARLRDELLNGEIFYSLREAQIVIESWRRHYNAVRPHASLAYKPPAPEVFVAARAAWPPGRATPAPSSTQHLADRGAINKNCNWTTRWGLINFFYLEAHLTLYPVNSLKFSLYTNESYFGRLGEKSDLLLAAKSLSIWLCERTWIKRSYDSNLLHAVTKSQS
jgi:hypothetical protein